MVRLAPYDIPQFSLASDHLRGLSCATPQVGLVVELTTEPTSTDSLDQSGSFKQVGLCQLFTPQVEYRTGGQLL